VIFYLEIHDKSTKNIMHHIIIHEIHDKSTKEKEKEKEKY
jgi:hypothetical protein